MTGVMPVIGGVLAVAGSAQATQTPLWTLADPPFAEIGREDGVILKRVVDAAIAADGSVVLADWGAARVWRMFPDAGVVDALLEPGGRLGAFRPWRVDAIGDTVLVYDVVASQVAAWLPNVAAPKVDGVPRGLELMAAVSSRLWIAVQPDSSQLSPPAARSSPGLRKQWSEMFIFDVASGRRSSLGRLHTGYRYNLVQAERYTVYRADYLGRTQVASANGSWVVAPMDGAALTVSSQVGGPTKTVALPSGPRVYSSGVGKKTRDRWMEASTPERAAHIRDMFSRIWAELPPQAPPVSRLVAMGPEIWARPLETDEDSEVRWLVVDPLTGAVRATTTVGPEQELLGGSGDLAVLVRRDGATKGEFIQIRRIVRSDGLRRARKPAPFVAPRRHHGRHDSMVYPDGSTATRYQIQGAEKCWSRSW